MVEIKNQNRNYNVSLGTEVKPIEIIKMPNGIEVKRKIERVVKYGSSSNKSN
jgi:hypothetical protein